MLAAEKSFKTALERERKRDTSFRRVARESRSKAYWYGSHIRLHLTWAQRLAALRGALTYNEYRSVSGLSGWFLLADLSLKRHLIRSKG